jgi:hypothetical protein
MMFELGSKVQCSNTNRQGAISTYELVRVKVILFSVTFNNISVISWWLVLLVEEIGVYFY